MELKIYDRTGALKLSAAPAENSSRRKQLMGEHVVNLSFTAFACVPIAVYDYMEWGGMRFWALEEHLPKQTSSVEWEYDCRFYGVESLLKQALVLKNVDGEFSPVFTLTAPAREHAALVVENINRMTGTTDWKVGEVIATANLTIDYEGTPCDEALAKIAEAAKTECWFDGMAVNIGRCEFGEAVALGYGNGLLSLERASADNVPFFTRLFPIGSTRNIDPAAYGHTRLQLPGGGAFVERRTEQGVVEHYEQEAFAHIYPRRVGTLSAVRSEERTGSDGKPFTIYYVKDADLPFDPNTYEIGGLVKRITFQSGELEGREFDVNFDTQKKEFEIITQWPFDDGTQLPGGALVPKAGDRYILWNIRMPEAYYALAEQEFAEAVEAFFDEHDRDRFVYKAATDYVDLEKRALALDIGRRVRLESAAFFPGAGFRASRITSLTQNLLRPTEYELELSDVVAKSSLERIADDLGEVRHEVRTAVAALPDIVRSWERTPASDSALYSALKSEREFLNKRRGGAVEAPVRFAEDVAVGGALVTEDFVQGAFGGAGAGLVRDGGGQTLLEVDRLIVRRNLDVNEVRIDQIVHTGGRQFYSRAGITVTAVEELPNAYRCYFDARGGSEANRFVAGDQGYCQRFAPENPAENPAADNPAGPAESAGTSAKPETPTAAETTPAPENPAADNPANPAESAGTPETSAADSPAAGPAGTPATPGNPAEPGNPTEPENPGNSAAPETTPAAAVGKYYWRLVTDVGPDWIDLSKSDADGDGVPAPGDCIAQAGHRTDPARQSLMEIDQTAGGRLVQYAGINSFRFTERNLVGFGADPKTGKGFFYAYGDAFIGDRDTADPEATFLTYQTPAGASRPRLTVQADVSIGRGSSGLRNLSEWSAAQQQIDAAQQVAEQASDDTRYLREGLREESTEIAGGLVLAKFLGVKGDNGAVTSALTAGRLGNAEVPLLFAGAESLSQATQTAAWYLSRDGIQKSRNAARTEAVTMSNGGMLFSRIGPDGVETESMSLSPTVYAPSAGSTAFGNTELIGTPGGTATVQLPGGRRDVRGNGNVDMNLGSEEIAWGDYFIWGNTFELGEHATLRIPAMTFTLELILHFQEWVYSPEDDRERPVDTSLIPSPSQHIKLSLSHIGKGEYTIYENMDVENKEIHIPAKTFTNLPAGTYRLLLFSEGGIYFEPERNAASPGSLDAFLTVPPATVSASWSGGLCRSKIFGNGWLFSKTTNQYCGVIGDERRFIFEQRCGTQGMRFDEKGLSFFLPDNTWGNYGLLCGYQVAADGTLDARFGMKDNRDSNCVRTATGRYTFNHYIGHKNYTAAIVLTSGTHEIYVINGIAANSVNIEMRNSAGVMKNRAFMITFYGKY